MIYLDYHATTPCDPIVLEAMLPYFTEKFANPSSAVHEAGGVAAHAVEKAREQVASLIGAHPKEIFFTSGATESNNLALQGLARLGPRERSQIVTTAIEHKSVLGPCGRLEREGHEVVILPVDQRGRVKIEAAERAITEETLVVSVQAASNEIGTIQSIPKLVQMSHEKGVLFHTDAAQAVGKIPIEVDDWGIDLLSISAHKLYGPKGVGALYVRGGVYSIPIEPLLIGGGQERGIRSGTLNVPGIIGFGQACRLCVEGLLDEGVRIASLRNDLEERLMRNLGEVWRNGDLENRLPGNSSLTFPGVDAEALIVNTPELAISTGSACNSGAPEPSYVLRAIGLDREDAYSTIRIGVGRFTTEQEISNAATIIVEAIERLKSLPVKTVTQ